MATLKLKKEYYTKSAIELAKDLIGKKLCTYFNKQITIGKIVETEAYFGIKDRACHAYQNRRTKRTEAMFQKGGIAYVYLCYGMHYLFNIVVANEDDPQAVLISGVEPLKGIDVMLKRRNISKATRNLSNGPGNLTSALGINISHNGIPLNGNEIWLENAVDAKQEILISKRINIAYAKEDALLPLRFTLKNSPWIRPIKVI